MSILRYCFILGLIMTICLDLFPQNLADTYKNKIINLKADPEFANGTDWESLFFELHSSKIKYSDYKKLKKVKK